MLKSFFTFIFNGIGLGIGLSLVIFGYDYYDDHFKDDSTSIAKPAFINVKEHYLIDQSNYVSIAGSIENISDDSLENVSIDGDLFIDGKYVDTCSCSVSDVEPRGTSNFKIKCRDFINQDIDEEITYKLKIRSALLDDG